MRQIASQLDGRLRGQLIILVLMAAIPTALSAQEIPKFPLKPGPLELGGPENSWRFIHSVGEMSALWGYESGVLESWVYPLKLLHNFQLDFLLEGYPRVYKGSEILRAVHVQPQMVQLEYSAEQFTVVETLFTPRDQPGSVILLDVKAPGPLKVFVHFQPDLNLMWPGGIGGQSAAWNDTKKWVELSEPTKRFSALVGSPLAVSSTAVGYRSYLSDEHPEEIIELQVSPQEAEHFYVPILIAGGIQGRFDAASTYQHLLDDLPQMYAESVRHYEELDAQGTYFQTPVRDVNESLRWSRVSSINSRCAILIWDACLGLWIFGDGHAAHVCVVFRRAGDHGSRLPRIWRGRGLAAGVSFPSKVPAC